MLHDVFTRKFIENTLQHSEMLIEKRMEAKIHDEEERRRKKNENAEKLRFLEGLTWSSAERVTMLQISWAFHGYLSDNRSTMGRRRRRLPNSAPFSRARHGCSTSSEAFRLAELQATV